MKLKAINKNRNHWWVEVAIHPSSSGDRATGTLYQGWNKIRTFDVGVRNGRFNVDIGTGSGVKVTFQLEAA